MLLTTCCNSAQETKVNIENTKNIFLWNMKYDFGCKDKKKTLPEGKVFMKGYRYKNYLITLTVLDVFPIDTLTK